MCVCVTISFFLSFIDDQLLRNILIHSTICVSIFLCGCMCVCVFSLVSIFQYTNFHSAECAFPFLYNIYGCICNALAPATGYMYFNLDKGGFGEVTVQCRAIFRLRMSSFALQSAVLMATAYIRATRVNSNEKIK